MTHLLFNNDWTVRPKTSIFAQIGAPGGGGTSVTLPHDALIHAPRDPKGSGKNGYFPAVANFEYNKTFTVPEEWKESSIWLEFQGAYRDAMVFVNDVFAGQRPYGYSIFEVPLDDYLQFGAENTIRVEVRGQDDSRWYTGVGIIRDVVLHVTDSTHLAPYGVHITHPDVDGERAVIEIAAEVVNQSRHVDTIRLRSTIKDANGNVVTRTEDPVTVRGAACSVSRQRLYLPEPHLWSIEDPYLYSVDVEVLRSDAQIDSESFPLGIRTLKLDPTYGLRINGETVKLRGACVHHDNGPLGGASIAEAEERRVRLLKDAGFNAIRSAHNPLSIPMLDACDRLGVIVMDESFDMWAESKSSFDYSLDFPEWWERDIESMVRKDRNHPSVIFYSIGNEIPELGTPLGAEMGRKLAEHVRAFDSTRFVTNGINGFVASLKDVMSMMRQATDASTTGGVNDAMGSAADMMNRISASDLVSAKTEESFSVLDAGGINYGDSRYSVDAVKSPNRIVIGSETFPGHIDVLWDLVKKYPHVLGDFTWTGWDYLGEVGIGRTRYLDETDREFEAPYPWIAAWSGDIDMSGARRSISYYRETIFGLRDSPYIAVHRPQTFGRKAMSGGWSWPDSIDSWTWSVDSGTPIHVDVYSDADQVELFLNSRSLGTVNVGAEKACIAGFDVQYEPGELVAVAYTDGVENRRSSLSTTGAVAGLTLVPEPTGDIKSGALRTYFIQALLEDSEGQRVTGSDMEVKVEVTGGGFLAGLTNGSPDSSDLLTGDTFTTRDGRLLIVVCSDSSEEEITISASAESFRAEITALG